MSRCKYCNSSVEVRTLGISGAYVKSYNYCTQHKKEAQKDRDEFLKKKDHVPFRKVPEHSILAAEFKKSWDN